MPNVDAIRVYQERLLLLADQKLKVDAILAVYDEGETAEYEYLAWWRGELINRIRTQMTLLLGAGA